MLQSGSRKGKEKIASGKNGNPKLEPDGGIKGQPKIKSNRCTFIGPHKLEFLLELVCCRIGDVQLRLCGDRTRSLRGKPHKRIDGKMHKGYKRVRSVGSYSIVSTSIPSSFGRQKKLRERKRAEDSTKGRKTKK